MGHVYECDPDLGLDPLQLDLELAAKLEVKRTERLVEQQHVRPVHEGSCQRDALLLAAGQLRRPPSLIALQANELERLADPRGDLRLVDLPAAQPEPDVVRDVEVREQRVLLEDHVDGPLVGWVVGDIAATKQDASPGR